LNPPRPLRVMLVDPSLFTAPYDAALTRGLLAAGVEPRWAVRPTRDGERAELTAHAEAVFYPWLERQTWVKGRARQLAKGIAHALGLARLIRRVAALRPDVVHFQWVVLPLLDNLAMRTLARFCPVVLTVHDTVPFNGERMSRWQRWGFYTPLRVSDQLIVHTQASRERLLALGLPAEKIHVIAHGALALDARPSFRAVSARSDGLFRFVLFGELKHYKGLDILVEALALIPPPERARLRVVVAGRPLMDLRPLALRVAELGLGSTLELRPGRLTEFEVAELFEQADSFVFPYRQVDASGVYFLVKSLGKWLIASNVGIFAEDLRDGEQGTLVPAGDANALARAMTLTLRERRVPVPRPAGSDWNEIGQRTSELYRVAVAERAERRAAEPTREARAT
jgi:glycosyltransferase involved in cell wall biosynthesis